MSVRMEEASIAKSDSLVKRILYAEAVYGSEEIQAVVSTLHSCQHSLVDGPSVQEFEGKIAALFGKKHGVMVNSGSSANLLAVLSLRLPLGAEIITPALTFSTTVAPLVQSGLVPVFVDVEDDTYVVDVEQIEEMIGPKTRGVMIPNLIGNLPDWSAIRAIAHRHGLVVVEDSADTVGALYDGRPTGLLSDISTTSFYASHVITAGGFGGMLCTDDVEVVQRASLLRGWGRSSALSGESERGEDRFNVSVDGIPYDRKFIFAALGYNFLPSEIGAAFGLAQYRHLPRFVDARIQNFERLLKFFRQYEEWFVLPRLDSRVRSGWLAFPLVVRSEAPFCRRELQVHLESHNVQTRTIFTGNILRQPGFADIRRRERQEGYPNADAIMRGGLLLGCHQGLDKDDIDQVCEIYGEFAGRF